MRLGMKRQFLQQHDAADIAAGLNFIEPVVYSENGNRSRKASSFLKKIEKLSSLFGVTRLANISHFSVLDFPVYQSTRPSIWGHTLLGQNSGSQGKGLTINQAKISCLMETLESYCMEPKIPILIRNNFKFLKHSHFAIAPQKFKSVALKSRAGLETNLMWTEVYGLHEQKTVLIPAELVYFPFITEKYDSRHHFQQGSNGIAAGATYLEACVHALYEVIERHYSYFLFKNKLDVESISISKKSFPILKKLSTLDLPENSIEVYAARFRNLNKRNLPFVLTSLFIDDIHVLGFGLSGTLNISITRAISEAMQGYATYISGSREDIRSSNIGLDESKKTKVSKESIINVPVKHTCSEMKLKKLVSSVRFKSLKMEFDFIVNWLKKSGYPNIYFANLTRQGIEIPVVKAIVPGLRNGNADAEPVYWKSEFPESLQFRTRLKK